MAPELKGKKRKSAELPAVTTKKAKKADAPKSILKTDRKRKTDAVEESDVTLKPKKSKQVKPVEEAVEEPTVEEEDASEDEIDDQTAALLKGFESSGDEEDDASEDEGGIELDTLPDVPNKKKLQKQLAAASKGASNEVGVIYVGRIPHGFYEHQMKAYFSQFGEINRLRLSRNKKTGRSKHYAFIEFKSAEVAEIVAKTMNNYLLFGHLLKVRAIPAEQVHKDLFKGAGTRFKVVPRNAIEARHLRLGQDRETWEKRLTREEKRRREKEEKLKAMGYEFNAPALKSLDEVPLKGSADNEVSHLNEAEDAKAKQTNGSDEGEAPKALTSEPHEPVVELFPTEQSVADSVTATLKTKGKKSKDAKSATNGVQVKKHKVKVEKPRRVKKA